jgi:hypothetical protein
MLRLRVYKVKCLSSGLYAKMGTMRNHATGPTRRIFLSATGVGLAGLSDAAAAPWTDARHPDYIPDPRIAEIFRDLASPLHSISLRDRARTAARGSEADLSAGYSLAIEGRATGALSAMEADFHRFLSVCMQVQRVERGCRLRARIGVPRGCPAGAPEAFHVRSRASGAELTARDAGGLRRGLIFLEDEMSIRRGPFLPLGDVSRWAAVDPRITHSPVAPYRWLSAWELEQDGDFYPDEYLNKLAHCGMNGIWVAGLLSRLVASKVLPELGPPQHRLDRLQALVERASRYGIGVYFFCIEPRAMAADHPVFAAHPEIRGAGGSGGQCLCVSTPLVKEYIRDAMAGLFAAAPRLAGVINIYKGERLTTCWTSDKTAESCPRCRTRQPVEVLAEDLNCFMEGIRRSSRTARFLAWGYSGNRASDFRPFIDRLNPEIAWLGNFEHDGEKLVHGRKVGVHEYSLSAVGPSEPFATVTKSLISAKRTSCAKLQIGNSYELSAVPYIPVPGVVYDKLEAARKLGVSGAMMSWIIGGYPSMQLKVAGEACFAPSKPRQEVLKRTAAATWGPGEAERVVRAWDRFATAFQLYLCSINVFYFGPIARCPAYLLHLEKEPDVARPYNWGLTRDRVKQPFEDQVSRWVGPFTAEELIASFREMAGIWNEGLSLLGQSLSSAKGNEALRREYGIAAAARIQFLSMANVMEFYTLRDRLSAEPGLVRRMHAVVEDDIRLAKEMAEYCRQDPVVGFQSEIYDYSFSPKLIAEKIRHDERTAATLARWEKSGVESAVLARMLPAVKPAPSVRPTWREWLRWGD